MGLHDIEHKAGNLGYRVNAWMERFSVNMAAWMQGRNGMDAAAGTSLCTAIILSCLEGFVGSGLLSLASLALAGYSIFRCFSRNVAKRQAENAAFLEKTKGPRQWIDLQYKRFKYRKTTCYFACGTCKTVYSVPKGKGKIRTTCPACGEQEIRTT